MYLVNGEEGHLIPVSDRGFQYGDGLFETIEIRGSRPVFLDHHLIRLQQGCESLRIPCPDLNVLSAELLYLAKNSERAVGKIIVTRGSGGRGYRFPNDLHPTRVISLHPFPVYPDSYYLEGICARFCSMRLSSNRALAGIKHLNRLEQVMARSEWDDPEIQEGLMLDIHGHVIEGTMTNLFYVSGNCLHTSPVDESGVAGIIRGLVMKLAESNQLECKEHLFKPDDLLAADELFICNSIIGLWPIRELAGYSFSTTGIMRLIAGWLEDCKQKELSHVE
ncbi:MAG: aminodeoxychorismate lyase [Gammaproteobacteria bacterium]